MLRILSAMWRHSIVALAVCCLAATALAQPKVIFVNPGKQDEAFWSMLTAVMQVAAKQLDVALEVDWASRDRIAMVDLGIAAARRRPDYLVLVNEQRSAWAGLEEAARLGVKVFILNNAFTGDDLARYGGPRERFANYIGALLPDNVQAGRAMGLALGRAAIARGDAPPIDMLAINGLLATPAAAERFAGLRRALSDLPQVRLVADIEADWSREGVVAPIEGLLLRHQGLQVIWAANDVMALGALDAAAHDGVAGQRRWLMAGLNWSPEGLAAIRDGRMLVSLGGHFLAGGCALVMLRDHYDGRDFADAGLVQQMPFSALDRSNLDGYVARFGGGDWDRIDFRSLRRGPDGGPYRFDPALLTRP